MTESEKINGWTFEETVKTATNLMKVEQSMFKWDVLRHLRDFAERLKPIIDEKIKGWTNSDDLRRWCERSIGEISERLKTGEENEI